MCSFFYLSAAQGRHTLSLLQIILLSVGLFLLFKFMIGAILIMRWMRTDNRLEIKLGSSMYSHSYYAIVLKTEFSTILFVIRKVC